MKEKITYIKVDDLKLNPNNPRKNDHAVDKVMLSIQKYGFKNPLIVGKDMVVYCGNTRLKGAKKIGLEEVPCIVVEDLDEKQIREYAILDNKLNEIADWDYDLLEAELTDLDLDEFEFDWKTDELEPKIERKDLSDTIEEKQELIVNCDDEIQLEKLYNELTERGYECKLSTL